MSAIEYRWLGRGVTAPRVMVPHFPARCSPFICSWLFPGPVPEAQLWLGVQPSFPGTPFEENCSFLPICSVTQGMSHITLSR